MELRVLRYFLMTAREENITRAAELLHVTQPTLSRQLMQLEEELGVKLFHRGSHHIVLTEDGMRLKRRASEIVSLAERTLQEFSSTPQMLQGGDLHRLRRDRQHDLSLSADGAFPTEASAGAFQHPFRHSGRYP